MTTPQVRRTSFLDTGALAKLYALWETCDQVGFRLDLVNTWKDVRDAVQRAGGPLASQYVGKDFTDIKSGLSLFTRMKEARADCDFFSCRAAYAELHRLVLVEMAIEKLTLQRVPRTIRNKRPLAIYQDALATTDFNQVNDDLDNFFEEMRINQRIDIKLLESNGGHGILPDPNKILDVAMVLWSHLMIETLDAYMYTRRQLSAKRITF